MVQTSYAVVIALMLLPTVATAATPTAADLSGLNPSTGRSNLQHYVEDELSKADRHGPILLPRGTIDTPEPLVLERINGVTIAGVSPAGFSSGVTTWNGSHLGRPIKQGTRLRYSGLSGAAVQIKGCRGVTLRGVQVERVSAGTGVEVTGSGSYSSGQLTFDDLVVVKCADAFQLQGAGMDPSQCDFSKIIVKDGQPAGSKVAMRATNTDHVVMNWYGGSYVFSTDTCFVLDGWSSSTTAGGSLVCTGVAVNGMKLGLEVNNAGDRTALATLSGFYIDRTGGGAFPTIVDVDGPAGFYWSGKVTHLPGEEVSNGSTAFQDHHYFFRIRDFVYDGDDHAVYVSANNLLGWRPTSAGYTSQDVMRIARTNATDDVEYGTAIPADPPPFISYTEKSF